MHLSGPLVGDQRATPNPDVVAAGPNGSCVVVPLGDVAFSTRGRSAGDPGLGGWSCARVTPEAVRVTREAPPFWRDYRRDKWATGPRGLPVCPDLARFLPR